MESFTGPVGSSTTFVWKSTPMVITRLAANFPSHQRRMREVFPTFPSPAMTTFRVGSAAGIEVRGAKRRIAASRDPSGGAPHAQVELVREDQRGGVHRGRGQPIAVGRFKGAVKVFQVLQLLGGR